MSVVRTPEQLDREKQLVAHAALNWVRSGMTVGLGSGTTMHYFIRLLGDLVGAGALKIEAVASSRATEAAAVAANIPLIAPRRGLVLDLAVDGADEISPKLNLLKGLGGALLREKALARASRYFLVIADSSKRVRTLGKCPLCVEVVPFTVPWVADAIQRLGGRPVLRAAAGFPETVYRTDQENYILDCYFDSFPDAAALDARLHGISGMVGHGLFIGEAQAALVAEDSQLFVHPAGRDPVLLPNFSVPLL